MIDNLVLEGVLALAGETHWSAAMRTVVILLLLANLTFFAYTRLDATWEGEAVRLAEQVQPDKIKLLTPQQVAALGPSKVVGARRRLPRVGTGAPTATARGRSPSSSRSRSASCSRSDASRRTRRSGSICRRRRTAPTRSDVRARPGRAALATSRSSTTARSVYAVSLGAFVNEDAAKARLEEVVKLGTANARLGPRQQVLVATLFVIRDPQAPVVARLRDLVAAYPGSEAKIGNCDKAQ